MTANPRKAALRAGNWLAALELPGDRDPLPRIYPAPRPLYAVRRAKLVSVPPPPVDDWTGSLKSESQAAAWHSLATLLVILALVTFAVACI